ncbi:16S rRNA (cytidine1402-2'-O)-methyltransferase [Stella humosa]|uniref:Ribosomal RNA small subunit methyltransferase I n=1 Tax=Stella humosa TaxID=94 RepID=A0A3N1L862_9PROT|nr:16S rRNA (cytidine(1402)-2'-O)-methyltransferase [Stella humosa]ROP90863.1 16S rRNA (cytidine1402-2'-O)-methyltransferase [Stella humosa]BBK34788.1 ribosomal RNA small subunit methyltransferase I [Stella humosa]
MLPAGLHVVATPIGNRRDITLRAIDTLCAADLIACEDTRVSGPFVRGLGATAPLLAYHDHNAARVRPRLLDRMAGGLAVALVSDAGTPLVSDPGYRLVAECVERGIAVTTLPGPSAPLAALVLSGLPSDRFLFAGFLPPRQGQRGTALAEVAAVPATLLFFETGPRLAESLAQMATVLGDRPAAVARELTKLHEEVRRGPLSALAAHYEQAGPPRGEIVVVVGPPLPAAAVGPAEVDRQLRLALATMRVKDAAAAVAALTGLTRREVYARALALGAAEGERE